MYYQLKKIAVIFSVSAFVAACGTSAIHSQESAKEKKKEIFSDDLMRVEENIATAERSRAQRQLSKKMHPASPAMMFSQDISYGMPISNEDRENYHSYKENSVVQTAQNSVSTFSVDVDTGAYSNVRRFLNRGGLPPKDAIRTEEMINYFSYGYPSPNSLDTPFSLYTEVAPSPWRKGAHLLHIGIKGYDKKPSELPPANLVFLVDVSGSMNSPDKLGLLKSSLTLLTNKMREEDRVAIAVYAGAAGVVLEPTPGNNRREITQALNALQAGGSTNGGAGINLAYHLAEKSFVKNGINRVIIATDGDFNVGTTSFDSLKQLIEEKRKTGIALTTLGLGTGNYNDHLMEQLADAGNGNHAYIDTLGEAQKVLVDEMQSTLLTIAQDVKIQIEFNPNVVDEYRLIGYENRLLNREDFNNDKVDAGDIGAGHTVTALYEVIMKESDNKFTDPLRYKNQESISNNTHELAFLKLRYKEPGENMSNLIEKPILRSEVKTSLLKASENYRFSAAVAAYGQRLRNNAFIDMSYQDIRQLASDAKGDDTFGYRGEFIKLIGLAESLSPEA